MEKKIVLLFGSFNPVTKSHVDTLVKSMEQVGGTKGIFIPTSYTHIYSKMIKNKGRIALSNEIRVKMLQSVCDNDPRLSVCTYEIDNDITSNTKQTIEYIIKQYPNTSIYYTCGADKLKSFSKWKNIDDIFKNVEVLVFNRSDIIVNKVINDNEILLKYKHKFHILDKLNDSDISSTKVRKLFLSNDQSYKQLLPQSVSKIFETLNPLDYPELELSEWIKLMFKYGGMHGKEQSLKEIYLDKGLIDYNTLELDILSRVDSRLKHNIKVEYKIESFPAKSYKGKFIPSGNYPTILITIGEGLGKNFWTMLYPDFFNISFV